MSTLYVIATPIGNLDDVSPRCLEALRGVGMLLCEDTRVTRRLLDRHEIRVPILDSYREDSHAAKSALAIDALREGTDVGFASDAGTPGISDPGTRLVAAVVAALPDTKVVPIPGPCAATALLSVSGFATDEFLFLGFAPHKGRERFFRDLLAEERTTVFYESPHRMDKALDALAEYAPERRLCVGRELTKLHETLYRGTAAEVRAALDATSWKGEFVVAVERAAKR
jgi:16S rRNA (cytidine1402-2'-O)-methyltransferase